MTVKRRGTEVPGGDPDETYVFSRTADRSVWARISYLHDKYRPLVWLAGILALAFGFSFKTPGQIFGEIHSRLDSLEKNQTVITNVIAADKLSVEHKIDALIKIQCFDVVNKRLEREAQLAGLDCVTALQGHP